MLHLNFLSELACPLAEFSRNHCIAVCSFLVPANLLTTLCTLVLTAYDRPRRQIAMTAGLATLWAGMIIFHVLTWFVVGVVMGPTYVLLLLGSVCLLLNTAAVADRVYFGHGLRTIAQFCTRCTRVDWLPLPEFSKLHELHE